MLVDILNSLILLYSKLYQNRTVPLGGLQACHSVVGKKISIKLDFVQREEREEKKKLLSSGGEGGEIKIKRIQHKIRLGKSELHQNCCRKRRSFPGYIFGRFLSNFFENKIRLLMF